ncbi:MAG: hypothetical protein KI785_13235 [Devosiaceae bacterium]|nr:hypothetical protein [Devosiaceae bacterium MH13]
MGVPFLAKGGRLLAALLAAAACFGLSGAGEAKAQTQSQLDEQPMRFSLVDNDLDCASCRYVRAVGDIKDFTAAQFRQFVRRYDLAETALTVVLDSPGGDVIAGLRLGREIRRYGFSTQVGLAQRQPTGGYRLRPGDCASACTFSFLGGVKRYAEDGVIGVHRFFPANLEPDRRVIMRPGDEAVAAMIKVYAVDMGVNGHFIDLSLDVPPADLRYLSNAELRELAVVNVEEPLSLEAVVAEGAKQ